MPLHDMNIHPIDDKLVEETIANCESIGWQLTQEALQSKISPNHKIESEDLAALRKRAIEWLVLAEHLRKTF